MIAIERVLLRPKDLDLIYERESEFDFRPGTTGHDNRERRSLVAWLRRTNGWDWLYDRIVPWMQSAATGFVFDSPLREAIQFTRYEDGGFYGFHRDGSKKNRRVVSASVLLKAPDRGGDLEVAGKQISLSPGDGVVFRSDAFHRVLPVTGRRDSLVLWLSGKESL